MLHRNVPPPPSTGQKHEGGGCQILLNCKFQPDYTVWWPTRQCSQVHERTKSHTDQSMRQTLCHKSGWHYMTRTSASPTFLLFQGSLSACLALSSLKEVDSLHVVRDETTIQSFLPPPPQCGSWPPHSWGFLDHTWRTTVGKTPLDEWSAHHRDLYLTTHNTHDKHPSSWWDSNPRSPQASGRRPTP